MSQDDVRVDLLKVKYKVFQSYPAGSEERNNLIRSSKLSEISYLSKTVPPELVNFVREASKHVVKDEIKKILTSAGIPLGAWALTFLVPTTPLELLLLKIAAGVFGLNALRHVTHLLVHYKNMHDIDKQYGKLKRYVDKLSSDVKRLEGPK